MKIYKLNPVDSHKSFYGKAVVYEYDDGTRARGANVTANAIPAKSPASTYAKGMTFCACGFTLRNMSTMSSIL